MNEQERLNNEIAEQKALDEFKTILKQAVFNKALSFDEPDEEEVKE